MPAILSMPARPLQSGHWLARRLGVSYPTIKRWSRLGYLDKYQISVGYQLKYDPNQIESAIQSGKLDVKAA
jgi:predicted site-specific integrase-resolvase